MPLLMHKVLSDAAEGRLELKWKSDELTRMRREMNENHQTTIGAISGAAMLISGAMLLTLGPSILLPATITVSAGVGLGVGGGLILIKSWLQS
jgi:ubiquinone biosynthesis protein